MVDKDFLKAMSRQEGMGKDLGKCVFDLSQGNSDRTANEQEQVVEVQESTSRWRAGLVDPAGLVTI